jgi:hypothetical protein
VDVDATVGTVGGLLDAEVPVTCSHRTQPLFQDLAQREARRVDERIEVVADIGVDDVDAEDGVLEEAVRQQQNACGAHGALVHPVALVGVLLFTHRIHDNLCVLAGSHCCYLTSL